jgi:hypothetical protein
VDERRSRPESAGRGAFGNTIGEPTADHAATKVDQVEGSIRSALPISH